MRYSRRQERVNEGGLLEASRHQLAKHVGRVDAESLNGTIPGFVAHLMLALANGHLDGPRNGQQATWISLNQLVLALAEIPFQLVQALVLYIKR